MKATQKTYDKIVVGRRGVPVDRRFARIPAYPVLAPRVTAP